MFETRAYGLCCAGTNPVMKKREITARDLEAPACRMALHEPLPRLGFGPFASGWVTFLP